MILKHFRITGLNSCIKCSCNYSTIFQLETLIQKTAEVKKHSAGEKGAYLVCWYRINRHIQYFYLDWSVRSSAFLEMQECQSVICSCLRICPWITGVRQLFVDPSESLVRSGPCPNDGLIQCKYSPSSASLLLPKTAVHRVDLASRHYPLSFWKQCKPLFSYE